jgi:prevent-host-death family protein
MWTSYQTSPGPSWPFSPAAGSAPGLRSLEELGPKLYDQNDQNQSGCVAMASWKVAEAKARLSELIETALREGAQDITRHGKRTVVVVAAEEWDRKARRTESLTEFLDRSPLKGSGLEVERLRDQPHAVEL